MYEDGDSFRRHVDLKRYGVNPTVGMPIGARTRVDLSFELFHDRRTADRGVPADGDEPIRGFNRTFFGDPADSFARADVNLAIIAIEHEFAGGLTLRNRTMFGDYDKFYQNIYPTGFDAGTGLVTLGAYNNHNDRRNLFSQTDLIWETRLGGIDQTLLLGFEVGREKSRNLRNTGTIGGGNSTPLTDPTVDVDVVWGPLTSDANNRTTATVAAAYVQDQVRLSRWIEIVAGLASTASGCRSTICGQRGAASSTAATRSGRRGSA